jgi:hypothetical protein
VSQPSDALKRPRAVGYRVLGVGAALLLTGLVTVACGNLNGEHDQASSRRSSLPSGVITPRQACREVIGKAPHGFFVGAKRVHLVLTTYAKGEPVQSQGDISSGMPPQALVWVVEVHAKAIHWNHGGPPGYQPPAHPYTDYSVVMNARTARVSDQGECNCWPLPLSKVGTLVSLSQEC